MPSSALPVCIFVGTFALLCTYALLSTRDARYDSATRLVASSSRYVAWPLDAARFSTGADAAIAAARAASTHYENTDTEASALKLARDAYAFSREVIQNLEYDLEMCYKMDRGESVLPLPLDDDAETFQKYDRLLGLETSVPRLGQRTDQTEQKLLNDIRALEDERERWIIDRAGYEDRVAFENGRISALAAENERLKDENKEWRAKLHDVDEALDSCEDRCYYGIVEALGPAATPDERQKALEGLVKVAEKREHELKDRMTQVFDCIADKQWCEARDEAVRNAATAALVRESGDDSRKDEFLMTRRSTIDLVERLGNELNACGARDEAVRDAAATALARASGDDSHKEYLAHTAVDLVKQLGDELDVCLGEPAKEEVEWYKTEYEWCKEDFSFTWSETVRFWFDGSNGPACKIERDSALMWINATVALRKKLRQLGTVVKFDDLFLSDAQLERMYNEENTRDAWMELIVLRDRIDERDARIRVLQSTIQPSCEMMMLYQHPEKLGSAPAPTLAAEPRAKDPPAGAGAATTTAALSEALNFEVEVLGTRVAELTKQANLVGENNKALRKQLAACAARSPAPFPFAPKLEPSPAPKPEPEPEPEPARATEMTMLEWVSGGFVGTAASKLHALFGVTLEEPGLAARTAMYVEQGAQLALGQALENCAHVATRTEALLHVCEIKRQNLMTYGRADADAGDAQLLDLYEDLAEELDACRRRERAPSGAGGADADDMDDDHIGAVLDDGFIVYDDDGDFNKYDDSYVPHTYEYTYDHDSYDAYDSYDDSYARAYGQRWERDAADGKLYGSLVDQGVTESAAADAADDADAVDTAASADADDADDTDAVDTDDGDVEDDDNPMPMKADTYAYYGAGESESDEPDTYEHIHAA